MQLRWNDHLLSLHHNVVLVYLPNLRPGIGLETAMTIANPITPDRPRGYFRHANPGCHFSFGTQRRGLTLVFANA